jgi:hypothetical protein
MHLAQYKNNGITVDNMPNDRENKKINGSAFAFLKHDVCCFSPSSSFKICEVEGRGT